MPKNLLEGLMKRFSGTSDIEPEAVIISKSAAKAAKKETPKKAVKTKPAKPATKPSKAKAAKPAKAVKPKKAAPKKELKAGKPKKVAKPKKTLVPRKALVPKKAVKPEKAEKPVKAEKPAKAVQKAPKIPVKANKPVKAKVASKPEKAESRPKTFTSEPLPAKRPKREVVSKKPAALPAKSVKAETAAARGRRFAVYPALPIKDLSPEYSCDMVTVLTLEPRKIFIYWEVTEETLSARKGGLVIRIYDVTGLPGAAGGFNASNANGFFEVKVPARLGSMYVDVMAEHEYIVDIGISGKSGFTSIVRSLRASTPVPLPVKLTPEEEKDIAIAAELFAFTPRGWYG